MAVGRSRSDSDALGGVVNGYAPLDSNLLIPSSYLESSELDYVEFTSSASITATSEATANTVVTAGAIAFDGTTKVKIEFFSGQIIPVSASVSVILYLYDGSSSIGLLGAFRYSAFAAGNVSRILTPSSASHTYSVRASVGSGTGTVAAGAGGSGTLMPGFIRITKVAGGGGGGSGGPGTILAVTRYAAGSDAQLASTTSATQADVDATNAKVTFTAPSSGIVLVEVAVYGGSDATANVFLGLRESTTDIIGKQLVHGGNNGNGVMRRSFRLTSVTGGSHTYKLAFAVSTSTMRVYTGPSYGTLEMTVYEGL